MAQSRFMSVAIQAVREAEKTIMAYYSDETSKKISTQQKADRSPVTEADIKAEKTIRDVIGTNFPDHGFVGEELGTVNLDSEFKWVIDPIDGTKNYARKIPWFATLLALMHNRELILGVSNAPAIRELMYAEKGRGAFLNGKQVYVSKVDNLAGAYLCFGGLKYFARYGYLPALLSLADSTHSSRGIGDFLCYHLLAQGKIDAMVEPETKFWDIAAFKVIVEEAGGKVTDIHGGKVTENISSAIATNQHIHDAVQKFFL